MAIKRSAAVWAICVFWMVLGRNLFAEDLWQKAVDFYAVTEAARPREMTMKFYELKNGTEEIKSSRIVRYRLRYHEDGETESELIYYEKNGEDLTGEEEPSGFFDGFAPSGADPGEEPEHGAAGEGESRDPFGFETSPFSPEERDFVSYTRKPEKVSIEGISCVPYEFRFSRGKYTQIGTAWLDAQSGIPVRLEYVLDPPIRFTSNLVTRIEYGRGTQVPWYVDSVIMDVGARFLLIRKTFQVQVHLADYI